MTGADRHLLAHTAAALSTSSALLRWSGALSVLVLGWWVARPPSILWVGVLCAALAMHGVAAIYAARAGFDAAVFRWWAAQDDPAQAVQCFDQWLSDAGRASAARSVAERARGGLRLLRRALAWAAAGTATLCAAAVAHALQAAA
ncbi:hypothetical protein M8A51_19885 [Schlegelella sp. S2-27]|uniref:Transmembrane protein n=1 Tax=Caldimonas mangrovi TaxID=2944811 RepID=A0ABT0YST5_9BURK|nr:hypothetical protein [Caldimonas mangrovi]MCM5681795.1 hypothetical protein [Caldimonas mangrovi]